MPRAAISSPNPVPGSVRSAPPLLFELGDISPRERDSFGFDDLGGAYDEQPLDMAAEAIGYHASLAEGILGNFVVEER